MKETLSQIFYPKGIKCGICDDEISFEPVYSLCEACLSEMMEKMNLHACKKCGRFIPDMADYCNDCKNTKWNFERAMSPFLFDGIIMDLIYKLKYGDGAFLSEHIASFLYDLYMKEDFVVDLVTFVPLHKKRLLQRGYNQAELIAKHFAQKADLPAFDLLEKTIYTKNLAKMLKAERQKVIEGSFCLQKTPRSIYPIIDKKADIILKNKTILLIDDVLTTGATANECAKILKKSGCKTFVMTFSARAIKPILI